MKSFQQTNPISHRNQRDSPLLCYCSVFPLSPCYLTLFPRVTLTRSCMACLVLLIWRLNINYCHQLSTLSSVPCLTTFHHLRLIPPHTWRVNRRRRDCCANQGGSSQLQHFWTTPYWLPPMLPGLCCEWLQRDRNRRRKLHAARNPKHSEN